jgi:hypothetical protein
MSAYGCNAVVPKPHSDVATSQTTTLMADDQVKVLAIKERICARK